MEFFNIKPGEVLFGTVVGVLMALALVLFTNALTGYQDDSYYTVEEICVGGEVLRTYEATWYRITNFGNGVLLKDRETGTKVQLVNVSAVITEIKLDK